MALNVAITNPTAASFIDAYPTGATAPGTASQNFVAGETLSSQVVAGVGTGGDVTIGNHAGTVDIVVDVDGYYTTGNTGGLLTVLASPVRLLDTRNSTPPGVAGGASGTAVVQGTNVSAGVLSIADLATTGNFLTAYATGATAPTAANVNYVPGNTYNVVENAAYAIASASGSVSILNGPSNAGTANIVVDEDGYFVAPATTFSVVASPASIPANGTATSVISLNVTHLGQPVAGDPLINYNIASNPAGVCVASQFSNDLANGDSPGSVTYTASHTLGTCTLNVTESDYGLTSSVVITQNGNNTVAVTPHGTVTVPTPTPASTGTPAPITVTATVTGAGAGSPAVANDVIDFASAPITAGGCGITTTGTGTTNASGVATFTFTPPTTSGFCTVTAAEATAQTGETAAQSGSTVIDSQAAATPTATTVAITPTPASPITTGSTASIAVAVSGAGAAAVVGDPINTVTTGTCGTLTPATSVTAAGGIATLSYTASATPGSCVITAIEANKAIVGTTTIVQNAPGNTVTVSAPGTVVESGTATVTATVTAGGGAPVAGDDVTIAVSEVGGGAACGTVAPGAGFTNASGVLSVTYTASATPGIVCTFTATEQATAPGTGSSGTATTSQVA